MLEIIERNQRALVLLSKGRFVEAQKMFFENARRFPSHETYHNLGYYLYSEGITCKNGKTRNADKLAMQYLLKAEQMKITAVNQSALAEKCEKQRNSEFCKTRINNPAICYEGWQRLECAVRLRYTPEAEYNRLRFWYFCDWHNSGILDGAKRLLEKYQTADYAEFMLQLLCLHLDYQTCLTLIPQYRNLLDELGLLTLYCQCGEFAAGVELVDAVDKKFSVHDSEVAMMAECLIRTGQEARAKILREDRIEFLEDTPHAQTTNWKWKTNQIFDSPEYRAKQIQAFRYCPPFEGMCAFFGCPIHGTPFYENQV